MTRLTKLSFALATSVALTLAAGSAQAADPTPAATSTPSPAKKALIDKIIQLQQQGLSESLAASVVQAPLPQLMQAGRAALQQVPAEKREATAKAMEAEVKKFVEENTTYLKDKTMKAVPSTATALLDERFTEDELRQVIAWAESPVSKKFGMATVELQKAVGQKVMAEAGPTLDGRYKTLQTNLAKLLGLPTQPPASAAPATKPAASTPAKK